MGLAVTARAPWIALAVALAAGCAKAPLAPSASAPAAAPRAVAVAARPGETTCAAAGRLGISVEALRAANELSESTDHPLGERRLWVPAGYPLEHRILPGQTLARVAAWYGHSLRTLQRANAIEEPDHIEAGGRLRIPPGARTGCPPPPVRVRAPSPPAVSARPPAASRPATRRAAPSPSPELLARADDQLEHASARYDAADFQAVVSLARSAQDVLAAQGEHPAIVERRARAAWLAGLAHAGLDDRENATLELREALALQPALRDDPRLSPRIRPLLEAPAVKASSPVAAGAP
jgi:LysM repeat protein